MGMTTHDATGTARAVSYFPAQLLHIFTTKKLSSPCEDCLPRCGKIFVEICVGIALASYISDNGFTLLLSFIWIGINSCALASGRELQYGLQTVGEKAHIFLLGNLVDMLGEVYGNGGAILTVPIMIIHGFQAVP